MACARSRFVFRESILRTILVRPVVATIHSFFELLIQMFIPTTTVSKRPTTSGIIASTMSMKLVKKLLQDHEAKEREEKALIEAAASEGASRKKSTRKRKRSGGDDGATPEEVKDKQVSQAIRNMLYLDQKMASMGGTEKKRIVNRIASQSKRKTKERKKLPRQCWGTAEDRRRS